MNNDFYADAMFRQERIAVIKEISYSVSRSYKPIFENGNHVSNEPIVGRRGIAGSIVFSDEYPNKVYGLRAKFTINIYMDMIGGLSCTSIGYVMMLNEPNIDGQCNFIAENVRCSCNPETSWYTVSCIYGENKIEGV